ncbi:hypothetical protein ElyMa_006694200 [Elysia marginata]|uniref:Uncharacterized protein n=1 Tax=Elysia marginata TaxID=1093978 RepID=A0AAV4ISR7_9GAST|nr:hypothetical protein ElyMa_006694200 [Elysia marginata]
MAKVSPQKCPLSQGLRAYKAQSDTLESVRVLAGAPVCVRITGGGGGRGGGGGGSGGGGGDGYSSRPTIPVIRGRLSPQLASTSPSNRGFFPRQKSVPHSRFYSSRTK